VNIKQGVTQQNDCNLMIEWCNNSGQGLSSNRQKEKDFYWADSSKQILDVYMKYFHHVVALRTHQGALCIKTYSPYTGVIMIIRQNGCKDNRVVVWCRATVKLQQTSHSEDTLFQPCEKSWAFRENFIIHNNKKNCDKYLFNILHTNAYSLLKKIRNIVS
jgi:hypothetical protein